MTMARVSILELFPVELLLMIKDDIPQDDLRTHVCFYKSCPPITSSLYGSEEEEERFWESACVQCGLGLLPEETLHPENVRWKNIAFDCIEQDGFCDHAECGGDRLEINAQDMVNMIDDELPGISRAEFYSVIPDEPNVHTNGTLVNPVLGYLGFHFLPPMLNNPRPPEDDAYLLYPALKFLQKPPSQMLRHHPIAQRSFATFPPSRNISIGGIFRSDLSLKVENAFGVTMWDIQAVIQSGLDHIISVNDMHELLEWNNYRLVFPPECDFLQMMRSLTSFRRFLTFFRINSMEFVDWDNTSLTLNCDFEPVRRADPSGAGHLL